VQREPKDVTFLRMAFEVAMQGTCIRRRVGCILVGQHSHVLATGFNGSPRGWPHCEDEPCAGADMPSGQGLELCEAIHAEQNALIQCAKPMEVETVYCTASPCLHCVKLLLNTSCRRVVFLTGYAHGESEELWTGRPHPDGGDRVWTHLPPEAIGYSDADIEKLGRRKT